MKVKFDIYLVIFVCSFLSLLFLRYKNSRFDKKNEFLMLEKILVEISEKIEYKKLVSLGIQRKGVKLFRRIYGTLYECCGRYNRCGIDSERIEKTMIERMYIYSNLLKYDNRSLIDSDEELQNNVKYYDVLEKLVYFFDTTRSFPQYLKDELIVNLNKDMNDAYADEILYSINNY